MGDGTETRERDPVASVASNTSEVSADDGPGPSSMVVYVHSVRGQG